MMKKVKVVFSSLILILVIGVVVLAETPKEGIVAHWRFESEVSEDGQPVGSEGLVVVKDITGHGNDLMRSNYGNSKALDLIWSSEVHAKSKSEYSIKYSGSRKKDGGSWLKTVEQAPINSHQFRNGYTIEVLFQITPQFNEDEHKWMGILARTGTGKDAGFTNGELELTLANLAVSNLQELQWATYPINLDNNVTSWSWELNPGWHHVALINDGSSTTMYVDGSAVMRNPDETVMGIYTLNMPWNIGASEWDNGLDAIFNGYISEIRILDHPTKSSEWLID